MRWPVDRNVRLTTVAFLVTSVVRLALGDPAEAAGPWSAQVVNAETQQPLEGVVVLAWWTRHVRSFGGPSAEFRDSQEVLSDKEGRFTVPLVFFRGPAFVIFKPGYGGLPWMSSHNWPDGKKPRVLPMPRLDDTELRKQYASYLADHVFEVPSERRPMLDHAILEEQKALGLRR